jgi:Polysaccharide pyruvyl transferase
MKKILVISPSGEVYDHDCVRWYASMSFAKAPDHYHNIGDAFVYDSSLKLLRYSNLFGINIRNPTEREIDRYNAEYDYVFLRGSNYLHPAMDWEQAPTILEKLRIPIIAFGIGAQAPSKGKLVLNEATQRVLAIIAERSVSLGVRGAYTADVLWSQGIRNARIIGCPTVFRNNDPNLRIDLPPLESVRDVAYTLRREVDVTYAKNLARYLDLQRDTILDLAGRFNLDVLAQGEVEEKNILWGDPEQRGRAIAKLRHENWLRGEDDPLEKLYDTNLFYADSVAEFEQKLRSKQLVLGYRLHGNLLGLANRVPSVYFTYDSRTAEFAETLQIPSFDVFSGKTFQLEDYWDQGLFEKFNRAYYQHYREMRLFLDENGVAHKMVDETAAGRAPYQAVPQDRAA